MSDKIPIYLIVGLGNPGSKYAKTRHNAGFWLLDELAKKTGESFRIETRFSGSVCKINCNNQPIWLLKPNTFMNRSGLSVRQLASYYKIDVTNILVVHDELDLPVGSAKLKQGGGHGGHNGLRDIHAQMTKNYLRLRLGIGHPGNKNQVHNYVLGEPNKMDYQAIMKAIDDAIGIINYLVVGDVPLAMNYLHTKS